MEKLTLIQVIQTIGEWIESDDVFVRDGKTGPIIPNAWIDCTKGSLLKRLCALPTNDSDVDRLLQLAKMRLSVHKTTLELVQSEKAKAAIKELKFFIRELEIICTKN